MNYATHAVFVARSWVDRAVIVRCSRGCVPCAPTRPSVRTTGPWALGPPDLLLRLMSENEAQNRVLRGMSSRITFGTELRYAMHVRGLSPTEVARLSGVTVATASSAAMGRPVNVTTALRVARAVAARPVVPELLEWVQRPDPATVGVRAGHEVAPGSPTPAVTSGTSSSRQRRTVASRPDHCASRRTDGRSDAVSCHRREGRASTRHARPRR
jgi:hypothetical protein